MATQPQLGKRKTQSSTPTKCATRVCAGGKPAQRPPRQLSEYPPRSDPRGFVLHHYRIFTGYTAGAICGADRWKSPESIWDEWAVPVEQSIENHAKNNAKHIPAIAAGHYWEESICCVAARCLYGEPFMAGKLCIRGAGPVPDSLTEDMRATADAFLCEPDGTLIWPPAIIEAKYSTRSFPHRPSVAHIFQLHHQMHVIRVRTIFIAYGHGLDATEDKDFTNAREFRVRVFRVLFSDRLWEWMSQRRNLFRMLVAKGERPTAENGFPRLHENFESHWVRREPDPSGLLPPEPTWTEVCESQSYTKAALEQLPKRLPPKPTLPDL